MLPVPITRSEFDCAFDENNDLRQLARQIGSLTYEEAEFWDISKIRPSPWNLLSNGACGPRWSPPPGPTPAGLQAWKSDSSNGFQSAKGLSLLFDPFVDASLAAVASRSGRFARPTRVLVLSDYDTVDTVLASVATQPNWAETETNAFFTPNGMGRSGDYLRKAIIGKTGELGSIPEFGHTLRTAMARRGILLWNYFPFLRGQATVGTGGWAKMLSACNRNFVYAKLDELLCEFLRYVKASDVVIACSTQLWATDHAHPVLRSCCSDMKVAIHRVRHPYVWGTHHLDVRRSGRATLAGNLSEFDLLFP